MSGQFARKSAKDSKLKRIKYFFLVFTFSFLAGSFYFLFENFGFFSLRGFVLQAPNAEVEKRFWDLLPPECIRYWPAMVFKSSQIRALMEKTIPVRVTIEAEGVGLFHTRISYFEPWLNVEWRGDIWHLSKEGRMWAPELYTLTPPASPLWKISETLTRYSDMGGAAPEGVFPALFPVEELERFESILSKQSWYGSVIYVDLSRRAGEFLLRIFLDYNEKKTYLTVNGKEEKFVEIEGILKQILPQPDFASGDVFIDMSYPDKVVAAIAHEGSLK